jgi:hypothetical protein
MQPPFDTVEPTFHAVQPSLDGGEIVAIAPGLLQDLTGNDFLAFDLALQHAHAGLKLLARYIRGHGC